MVVDYSKMREEFIDDIENNNYDIDTFMKKHEDFENQYKIEESKIKNYYEYKNVLIENQLSKYTKQLLFIKKKKDNPLNIGISLRLINEEEIAINEKVKKLQEEKDDIKFKFDQSMHGLTLTYKIIFNNSSIYAQKHFSDMNDLIDKLVDLESKYHVLREPYLHIILEHVRERMRILKESKRILWGL